MRNALLIVVLLCLSGSLYSQTYSIPVKAESGVYFFNGKVYGLEADLLYHEAALNNRISLSFAKKLHKAGLIKADKIISFPGTDTISLTAIFVVDIVLEGLPENGAAVTVVEDFAADIALSNSGFGKNGVPVFDSKNSRLVIGNTLNSRNFMQPSKLTMLNGKTYNVTLTKFDSEFIQFKYKKPKKIYNATREKVFSVTDSLGRQSYVYYQDTAIGRPLSVYQMQNFLIGYNDGRRYRWGGDFAIGFASGVGGSFLGVLYGFSIPIGASALNSVFKPKVSGHRVAHPELMYDEYYQNGMRKKVRQRKIAATLFGGATGMGVGIVIFQFLVRPLSDL